MNSKKLRNRKIFIIIFLLVSIGIVIKSIPSLARIKNRTALETITVWDGTVASSYRKGTGTSTDPYIIASGGELAYFGKMLETTDYEGKYFALSNDILLNKGIFSYEDGIKYTLNKSTFYIKEYTNDFYDNSAYEGVNIGSVNMFKSFGNFKGHLNGNSYTIYGLYISEQDEKVGLFKNLTGEIKNLYISNSLIYGGVITGSIAASSEASTIDGVIYQGSVIGNKEVKRIEENYPLEYNPADRTITIDEYSEGSLVEATLTGTCSKSFKIGNSEVICNNNSFTTSVNTSSTYTIDYESTGESDALELSNLNLKAVYDIGIAGGLIGYAKNVTLKNAVNKSTVYASVVAGGLVGESSLGLNLSYSYNKNDVIATNNAGGLIGVIKNIKSSSKLSYSYNDGGNNLGLIAKVENGDNLLTINNSFEARQSSNIVKNVENSQISVASVYTAGNIDQTDIVGTINKTTREQLTNKTFLTENLNFYEFQDTEDLKVNKDNVWFFEVNSTPILYIDEEKDPLATLNMGIYSWNNLGFELNTINLSSNTAFAINEGSSVRPIKEAYYYICNSKIPLRKDEIDNIDSWIPYENIVSLEENGFYIIYAKVTDYNGNTSIINSDLIVIDKEGSAVTLKDDNNIWDSKKEDLSHVYIGDETNYYVEATDELSGIKSIEYTVTNTLKTQDELENITWEVYADPIKINTLGSHVIYIKVSDNAGNITYINSDYIVYGGYHLKALNIGKNKENMTVVNMTNRSSVSYNFTYNDQVSYQNEEKHHIVTNIPLPVGTKITLKDNLSNKVYIYELSEEKTSIPFVDFKEVGKALMDVFYNEVYSDKIDEDYTITLDFKNSQITSDINSLKLHLDLIDKDGNVSRSTFKDSIKDVNVFIDKEASPTIESNYQNVGLIYNSDSVETIDINTNIEYQSLSNVTIHDTLFDDMKLGIAIKMVDKNGNIIPKEYLKNVQFKIENNYYSPNKDGITRIKLTEDNVGKTSTLTIVTSQTTSKLEEGTYYYKISSYAAYDGLYSNILSKNEISIPVIVNKEEQIKNYNFDVLADRNYKILFKKDNTANINFEINRKEENQSSNVRVMLYKKDKLTAYDQSYTLVDLKNYTTSPLREFTNSIYYAEENIEGIENKFNLNFDLSKFTPGGYKLKFELYDENKKIGSIENKFIVR